MIKLEYFLLSISWALLLVATMYWDTFLFGLGSDIFALTQHIAVVFFVIKIYREIFENLRSL